MPRGRGQRLFAFPAQSNFSGVHHPLTLVADAQKLGYQVLIDAAAYLPTHAMSLRRVKPEFVVLSLYKLFGYPTGVGALVARRDALARLRQPWFAGGTVDWVSVRHGIHQMRPTIERFEEGTANFMGIACLAGGFEILTRVGMARLTQRVQHLTDLLLGQLLSRRHANGSPVFVVYGPRDLRARGGTVAFNVLNESGRLVHYEHVEAQAAIRGVAVRGGCFCNPGASEAAFGLPADRLLHCLSVTASEPFTPRRLADCIGGNVAVGAIRASVGLPTSEADILDGVDALAATVGA
jgi:selenocysteine lyase/cysteine desulfurase